MRFFPRRAVARAGRRVARAGLVCASGGNIALRDRRGDGCYITARGAKFSNIRSRDVIWMALEAEPPAAVSSEWRLHRDILLDREDVGAVVHTHSPWAGAFSCRRRSIRPFHYTIAMIGGEDIRCADYAPFGTAELSRHAVTALADRRACLLAHHGVVALGADLDAAVDTADLVEFLARVALLAETGGDSRELSAADIEDLRRRFDRYRAATAQG